MEEVPLQPPEVPQRFRDRSAVKAAIVSTAMGTFALLRVIRKGDVDPWGAVIDFGEKAMGDWLSAWLGIQAAGQAGARRTSG